jgi:hypothetical protein
VEDERQLSLGQLSQQTDLTVSTCQRIVRKDLEDSVTAERYRNNSERWVRSSAVVQYEILAPTPILVGEKTRSQAFPKIVIL